MFGNEKLNGILLFAMVLVIFVLSVFAAGAPQINITDPRNGGVVSPGDVTIDVSVTDFDIVAKQGQANVAGEGHIHYFMDVAPPTTPGRPAVTAEGTYVHTTSESYTWRNVSPGEHTFSVELTNNDHTPLTPAVVDMVRVTARGAASAIRNITPSATQNMTNAIVEITEPENESIISGGNVTVTAGVDNFNIVPPAGRNVAGSGHLVFLMDTDVPTVSGRTINVSNRSLMVVTTNMTHTWTNVPAGNHSFSAVLVNNDNTTLNPSINDTVYILQTGSGNISTALGAARNETMARNQTTMRTTTQAVTQNRTTTTAARTATVNLVARNNAFNMSTITVPAEAGVTINFDNQDSGVQHNFAAYTDSSASTVIYKGPIITGPNKTTYTFTAPSTPGTYFFRCDIHPTRMTGRLVVQ